MYRTSEMQKPCMWVFPVRVWKSIFVELRLKELFQMFLVHLPDWTSVWPKREKKFQKCVYFGVHFQ